MFTTAAEDPGAPVIVTGSTFTVAPAGIEKLNTDALPVPELVTDAEVPALTVVVVPTAKVLIGRPKLNTAAEPVPELVTVGDAFAPRVVTVPAAIVAAAPPGMAKLNIAAADVPEFVTVAGFG